ncbi:MAG TPA: hypothetical protein PKK69_08890, partial [Ferruginibacter sp.]|nr:hypothetical protein [Ferruginibacter sp.]
NTGATLPGCTYTTTFTGATSTGIVVPIDFTIPVGTGHRLVITNNSAGVPIWRDFTGNTYPYALGALGNITGGYIGGSSGTYYFFYNWQVTSACEGIRTAVTATVTAPPAITPSATPATVCGGTNVSLNVTSSNGGYTYVWTPGSLSGAAQTVNPVSSTTYSVTATDASAGPFSGCVNVATVNVTVNATPTNVTVSPAVANVCASPVITQITASGGLISNQTIHQEFFETFPLTQYTVGGSGLSATQNTTYYQSGSSSVYLLQTSTGTMDGDIRMNSSVNLTNYTNPSLSFYHICGLEGAITAFDFGYIEYSTDGGTSWTSFPTSTYSGTATLFNGVVSYSSRSYTDWNAQFSGTNSTPGTGPATALWKKETIDLSSYASQSNFRIRFRVTGDINTVYYGWLIDSVRISGTGQAPITWSPTTDLYTDPGGTISYLGGPATTVYTKPTASRIYTATATGGAGCTKTAT